MPKIEVNRERCKGCTMCMITCPKQCIEMSTEFNKSGYYPAKLAKENCCIGCKMCFMVCPDVAITVYKEEDKK